jgi:N12 class adenine-specific DNA methylase
MPDKKFYVQIPGTTQGMSVSAEDFEAKKDKLFNTYKDAVAVEMQDYTNGEDVGDSDFVVTIPGTTEPMQINAADFAKKKDKLFEQYPDAKVTRVRGVNYWGNKLQEGEERIRSLEEELKGIPEDVPLSEDPRAIQGGSIVGMQKLMVEKQRREAPNRERRGQIKREIEQIKRDREDNPAWQQYWEQQGKENDEARARIGQMQERNEAIMKEHSLDSALAAGDDDYLRIADRFYKDAKKMIDAPSKYAEDNQGALGDFWQGIKDTGWNALSLVDFAQKLQEIPFLETVKKIQKSEGNNANVYDLIKNHTDRLYEMGMGDAEVEMLKAFVHKADVESGKSDLLTKSYQAGQSMAKSLGFMADFIAFGGIGDAAAEAVAGTLVKQAGRRAVPKLAAESFGGLVKAAAMTPLMPSTYANFIGNLEQFNDAGGIDLSGKAMLKDVGDILIENVSETIGAKPLELIGMPLQKVKFPAWAKAMRNSPIAGALKQAGYNGFFEEMFEEWTGSALRTMTGVDKDALKDFWQVDQILVTAGSFAPVALLGGSVSAAQFHTASKSMRDKGAVIDGIIGGLQDENAKNAIKESFDKTRDIETPEDLAHAMTDVYQQIVKNGGNEEQAFKAVMDYTEAASRYKVMNGMFEEQKDIERSQKLAEMDQQMGNAKWHHLGKNGSSYVRTITDDQGNERFVTGEDDTNLLVVDRQGKPGFISKESLATGVEDGTLTDSGEQYLFDYLDKQNRAVKQQEEQTRMADETKAAHEEVVRRALPDTPVNPEKPEEGIFRGIVGGRYVIQYPDGSSQDFSEEEIANKLGIRTVPETDAEIEAKDDAHEEKLENMHTAMNQFKGRHIVLPGIADMGYTLTGVVRNRNSESYPFSVFFRDADGHESGTGVSEEDMDALLAEMQAEQPEVQVPDVEPEVEVADNIPRDFRGNPLPMRQNEQTGETVVDEDALRERDIEAWVRYNDANPNRVVSSRDWLAFNIKKTASEVTKAADEITNAELNGVPARQKDAMKKALADKEKLLQSYESAMQRLTTPEDVIGDMQSYIADDQQPEAKEPAAAPSVRDFRGNPIPMADESEVDETAFFQQDPEAWMEWNNAQMNDGGEDSRNYVKGEIGRENKNISRLQKEYNGEKDFKKRKELRMKIQESQQRIADLEQALENVEKRMQRRAARELEPQSVDEVIALGIANSKGSIDRDELKRETGMSDADLEGFVGGFVKEGGMSIGQLAEAIKANDDTHLTDSISDDELRSDIIEFLRGSTKWSDITNYIANKRAVQQEEQRKTWLLSAFEKKNSALDNTTDTGETLSGEQNDTATLQNTVSENKDSEISETQAKISEEEAKVDTEPTEAQKEAGNYRKGHIKLDGYNISIEQPKGSIRSGIDEQGNPWSVTMNNTYGYIRGTEGVDGDHIDVFLSDNPEEGDIFVVDQIKPDGSFDEHKVMFGFPDMEAARKAYLSNYSEGWQGLGAITAVSREEFKKWVESSHRKTKPFAEYKSVTAEGEQHEESSTADQEEESETVGYSVERRFHKKNGNYIYALSFKDRLSKDEFKELKNRVKDFGGYYSSYGKGGFIFDTEDAARKFGEAVMDQTGEKLEEARPVSMEDLAAVEVPSEAESTQEPENPSGNKLVTDEKYAELRRRMLEKLKGQMNMGIDPEILSIGVQMAVYHVEKGARKFVDFAKNMIADLGDAIRPYLKAFYNGARDLPEVEDAGLASEMTPYDEVRTFDVANFDKAVSNPIETAAEVVKEQEVQQQKEVAEKEIKKTRKSRKSSQNVLSLSLADGTSFTVDRSDYHTFLTPQAKEFFERLAKEDGRNFAFPELAYITYASENNVIIPASELEALPEFIEAERRIAEIGALAKERTGSEALAISEDQVHALADRLLEEGSYVGKKDYSGEVAREKKAFVIIGRPAAGKSSVFANPLSKEHKARIIDSDTVKPWLEGYDGGYGANYVHGASVRVADEALIRSASLGENIIIPRIGGRSIISETVLPLRAVGYSVELCYNELPTEGSIMRAAARFVQTGRYLSLQYLNAIGEKPINTYRKFVTKSIGETINELSEREIQELRRRLGRLLGVEDRMAGASGPGGREVLSGVPETLGEGFRALLEHGEFGSDPSSDLLVFDGSEWKNNDVDYGIPPVTVWSSKSGEPFPGPKEGPNDNKNIKPSKKKHADEGMTLFDMMEENNNENEPETTDSTQGEGSPDRAMGGVSAVGDRVLGTDGSGQSDGTEAGGNRAGEPGVAGEEPQLLSTVGSGRGSESVVDSGSQGQPELSDGGSGVQGGDATDGRKAVRRDSQKAGQKKGVSKPAKKFTRNFHYGENASEIDNYTPAQRLKANIDAVEVLATMFSEGRQATDQEKETLSKFRGWGGIPFGHYYSTRQLRDSYSSDAHRLADAIDVLDPNGEKGLLPAISKAALTSYYTPSAIARTMNRFLALSGFKGGSMLDPSMGSGIFEGTLPEDIQQRTMINGVELDWLTGQIAKALYPDANVQIKGFEEAGTAMDAFDVVESNIPFGSIKVFDPTWKHDSTPVRKAAQGKIHNYFAVKMLESTKPGGLCVIMTSNAILDTEGNSLIREHIADQAEILGIVRLPDNTFKGAGTSAVTDVLFLRKFRDSDDRNTTRDEEKYRTRVLQPFLSMTTKDAAKKTDSSSVKVSYNGYFGTHPEFMIGDVIAGNQYKADAFGLTSNMSTDEIADAMDKILEKKIVGSRKGKLFDTTKSEREVHEAIRESYVGNGDYISSGNIVEQDGKFGVVSMSKNKYGDVERNFQELPRLNGKAARIQAMFPIRTTMKKLVAEQIAGASNDTLDGLRKQLKESYDKFVKLYGRLQDSENTFLDDDIDGYMLRSLEKWREGEFVGLSDIFTKNTIKPAIDLSQAQDGQSAISVSLAEYGEIRPAFMEQMLGEKWYDLCKEMVFRIPFSEDRYETKDAYLSGDVKTKLEQARKAAEMDKSFQHNVDELEAVQPKDIPFDDISVHMGARWIPQEIYTQFLVDSFGISSWRGPKSGVLYSEVSDTYIVNVASSELGGAAQKWATRRRSAKDIFEAALSDKTIKVVDKDDEGKEYLNVAETEAANEKVQELRESFEDWLPKNAERVKQVAALYNDRFNRTVLRKFDGSHLKTPGLMGMELRPHQKDAVWMLINNRGGIVDHMVGAGKTLVMQSAIMEMRRMGIAKKPMIVALKSTIAQITKEFIEAYPSARILAPTEKDFEKKRRKELLAKIALNDYDCVIISHENYVGLPHTEEVETQVIREQLAQLDAAIQFLYGQEDQSQLTKRQLKGLEKRKANLEAKMQALLSRKVDREFTFESLGVDYLFVDECQAFKSLPYVTSYQNVAGLGDAAGSQKAVALLNGVRYLQSLHQGDMGTTFLSGTTITNSLVEIYNLLQYLRPREMESLGFTTFDAWAGTFAQRSGELEYGVTQELKEKNRFRRFDNVPELARLYAEIADVRNDMNLKLPKPKPRMHIVTVPASEKLNEINAEVINMVRNKSGNYFYNMGAIKKPTTDKSPFGLLASGISTKAAISMKLLDPNAEEEGGKIHAVCENVAEIYKKFNDQKGTQLIFCDTGVPTKESEYDVYTDIIGRLVNDYGIPRDEIVDIHVADTDKKRKELFTKVREGTVRVLIGGTKNMGTGVNVQTRLVALHHIDVPWTPADREQREGRGVRQGNIVAREFNDDNVDIYFYAAEESLDLYKYQLQDTKGKMFTQFKQGTIGSTERSFDEGSGGEDGTFDPAEIVALLSGNPVILEKSKQDKKVEKLRRAKRTFESEWHQRKSQYDSLQSYLYTQESFLRQNKRDIDSLEAGGFKKMEDGKYPTTVTVEDYTDYGTKRTFDKPKEAGEYIHKLLKKKGASVRLSGFGQKANIQMAEVSSSMPGVPAYEWQVVLQAWSGIPYRAQLSEDDTAAGVAFRNVLQKVFSNRETYQKNIDETKHKLEGADPGEMVFPKQAELDEAEAKKKELDAQYKALAPKEEKKPASSENPEESVSLQHYDINLEGTPEEKSENIHRTSVGEDLGTVGRRTGEVSGRDNDYGVWRRSYDISDGTGPGAGRISLDNLERLFRDTNINQEIVPLFEKVIALAKENGVIKTYFRTPKSGEIRGQAMYTGDVYFNPSILTAPEYTGESAVTILHELIHGLTISTLRSHELGNKLRKYGLNPDGRLTAEQKAAAKEIERIYKRLHDNLDTSGMSKEQKKMLNYRLVNQYEMVAGMSDQRFRDYLRSVEDGPTNLWERLKAAIKRILGIESGDILTRLEKALDNLLDNFRIETFEDTSGLKSKEGFEHYSLRETSDSRAIAGGLYDRYENQNGEDKPWMSEEDLFERVEAELPYDQETKPMFALIDEYRRLSDEDFDEGRRDFSGGEMSDLFNNFLSALKSYSEDTQVRNRIAGVEGFISNAEAAVNAITQEMKESVMEWQLMFREGNTQSPVQYSESNTGKRDAVNRVAELCGVEIEFKPSSEMRFKGKPLAGRWINGRMQICLEHCRDEADAVRTVLHEGVGHNGLRRLIGNENMREFCLELFQRLPEQARKQIADAAVNKYGLNIAEAVEEYLAEQAEVMDFENGDYSRSFWDMVRDALRKVLSKIGIDVSLSERDVRWLMWQSYNANKQRDPLNEVKRQVVANKLGFTLTQQADKMEGIQIARNRMAQEDEMDAASDAYNEAAASLWNRMKETFVDQYQSVGKLVSAIEDATGKKAASFEDIRLALNRHSSKALATMQKWIGKYNTPMWDAIKELREKIGGTVNDVSRYVMLKHGLERNEVFAKRDAREYYQGIRDRAVNEIKATKDLSKDEKDHRIAKEDDRLEKHLKSIEAGTNAKYREFRQRDYGGLTSFYSEFDEVDPQRPGEGKERYNARLQKARHPKYTTVDENGRVVVDMAATEKAAADEVAAFERQSEGLTDKLWQRINAATKATLEHQYQSNMLSRKQYEQVRDMFKYYVPLRGFEDDTAQDLYSYYNEDQRGNFERLLIRATGRKTRAESPFGHIGAMASSGIAADMKNETKLSLYYFVSNRPNDLVTISDVWYEKTGETDEDGREVFKAVYPSFSEDLSSEEAKKAFDDWEEGMKEKAKSGLAFKGRKNLDLHNAVIHIDKGQKTEHVVKFKVGGRDMMMYINGNPRAAQAINGELNYNAENNFFVRAFKAVLRTMAALNTALNPEFWISNFQRDALFSLMSVDVKEGSKYRDAFAKNLVSGKTIFKMKKAFDEGTLGDSKDEQLFREFAENGGITGYTVVYDNEYWEKKLDEYAGKDRNVVARFNDVFKSISDFGEAVEIRTRFAAYKTSREMGKDIIGSVNDAKELTVNFNRKGSGKAITLDEAAKLTLKNGKMLRDTTLGDLIPKLKNQNVGKTPIGMPLQLLASMFSSISPLGRRMIMFFNAAVQGLNAMVKLYKTNPKRMAVWSAGYLAVGMINAVLHSMLDDDDDYLDIPDWERRNNLLLGGKGAYFKWALPQEARVFYALGDMVVNHALGREPHKYLAVELLDAVGEALPIDVASGVGAFLPSAAMPVIDIVRNKDYKGAKVHNDRRFYSEEERKDIPKWRDPLANTGGLYVGLAKVISRITGGDEYGAGWWNPDPNDIEHLVEGYTGGLGTTVEKMLQFFGDIAGGEFVVRDTPFLRRILSLNDERYRNTHTTELYYYYTNRAKDTKRKIREARKNGDADKLDDLYESDDFEIMNICESYDGLLKWYSDELKFTDDKQDRKAIMHEQDAVRKEMIQEISNIGKQ